MTRRRRLFIHRSASGISAGSNLTDWLHAFDPAASLQDIRGLLGRMLFKGDEGNQPTERCRAAKPFG